MPSPLISPRRILIIRPSALGDVCRSTPVLVSLRQAFPDAHIDWLVQDVFADAISAHPALTQAIPFPRARLARWWTPGGVAAAAHLISSLRAARYELVVDCQGLARSGFLARATAAPVRVGHADAREAAWLAYTHRVPPTLAGAPALHTVDRMLSLIEHLGVPPIPDLRIYPPAREIQALARDPALARPFIVLAPTSRWTGKRWPAERFAALARVLLAQTDCAIIVVGSASERSQCGPLLDLAAPTPPTTPSSPTAPRLIDRLGATSVGGLMALIDRAALVIANDSAALHMAVGLSRPLVALYGPTDAAKVGPYGPGRARDVLQHITPADRLDHKDHALGQALMARITVAEVAQAALAALSAPSAPSAWASTRHADAASPPAPHDVRSPALTSPQAEP